MHDDMVERVAIAISAADAEFQDVTSTPKVRWSETLARAAIVAMREPTHAMLTDGGNTKVRVWDNPKETFTFLDDPSPVWKAMIDAALQKDASNAR